MDNPTYNADGIQTWKPQPGEFYEYGLKQRLSYGGIVAAVQDVKAAAACGIPKSYPNSFAGIIAALEDLAACINSGSNIDVDEKPPGWEIIINPDGSIDGDWTVNPKDGNLWFDTRQGRLFVSIDGQYWQTNGGDGLAYVDDGVPAQQPVIGSTWFDTANNILYVWTGQEKQWQAVSGADDVAQTTATLPLAFKQRMFGGPTGEGRGILPDDFPHVDDFPSVLPPLNLNEQNVQSDFNAWLLWSLYRVGEQTDYNTINFGPTPPPEDTLQPGSMWYDTNALELSVWYSDGDSSQWVPTSVSYQYDAQLASITTAIETESSIREASVQDLTDKILSETNKLKTNLYTLDVNVRKASVDKIAEIVFPEPDLSSYSTTGDLSSTRALLESKITEFKGHVEAELLQVKNELSSVDTDLINTINSKVTTEQLEAVSALLPDISQLTTEGTVDSKIASITNSFLPRTGGVLKGRFELQKDDIGLAALDFSRQVSDGRNALMLKAYSESAKNVSFGTTETEGEVAFVFDGNEDFCWIFNDTEKVFSVDRNGPAAETLILGDFGNNDNRGRTIHNKIDVRDRLETYQTAFEQMRQGVANASDFDELKSTLLTALTSV